MQNAREIALRENFDFFQGIIPSLMSQHAGEYALLRSKALIDVFQKPMDALEAGYKKFADGLFSVQKVTDRPFDLGFMSYGAGDRTAD